MKFLSIQLSPASHNFLFIRFWYPFSTMLLNNLIHYFPSSLLDCYIGSSFTVTAGLEGSASVIFFLSYKVAQKASA
jgi:hypothetical protein